MKRIFKIAALGLAALLSLTGCSAFYPSASVGPDLFFDGYYDGYYTPGYDYGLIPPPPPPPPAYRPNPPRPNPPRPNPPQNNPPANNPDYKPGGNGGFRPGNSNNPESRPQNGGYRGNNTSGGRAARR